MIIGFLGKGGSGKSTIATLWTKYLLEDKNNFVLAIDNDHNMDYKYNLVGDSYNDMNYMGDSLSEIFEEISISATSDVANIDEEYLFTLSPADKITTKYSVKLSDRNMRLMVSGPHSNDIMYGNSCSHSLTTPLKVYLPLLKLNKNEYCIVDEKAGTDGVGTGVTTGFNLTIVIAEATIHGIKSAKQIIQMLRFYNTPFIIAINKIKEGQDIGELCNNFQEYNVKEDEILKFYFDIEASDLQLTNKDREIFTELKSLIDKLEDDRLERTKNRIQKQREYNNS